MFHYNEFNQAASCWWNFGSEFGQCSISYDIIEEFWSVIVRFVGVNLLLLCQGKQRKKFEKKVSPFWSEIFHKGYYLLRDYCFVLSSYNALAFTYANTCSEIEENSEGRISQTFEFEIFW